MDTTTMVLGGFQQMAQHDASRRIVPTEYIVNYSTYAQYMHNYPLSFNYGSFGCSSSPATVDGFTTLCSIGAQQSLCVPPPYTDPRCIAQVQSVGSKSTQSSNSPFVKAEDASPEEAGEGFHDISPQKLHSPGTSTEPSYGTDVDTLMRAIQTKSGNSRPQSRSSTSSQLGSTPYAHGPEPRNRARETGFEHTGFRTRKKYQCYVPSCAKIFFQKTHLEIHVRAHTGHKPFVSISDLGSRMKADRGCLQLCKEASCGQRFSQLGNLKVRRYPALSADMLTGRRRTSAGIQESDLIHVKAAGSALLNEGTSAPTESCTSRSSPSPASSRLAESSLPNSAISK